MESYLLSEQQTKVTDASSARSKTAILHKCVSRRPLRLLGLIKQSEEGMSATEPLLGSERKPEEEDEGRSGRYSVWKSFKMAERCIIFPSGVVSAGQCGAAG